MPLDVETPPVPDLEDSVDPNEYDDAEVVGDTDYRRGQLEGLLRDGAWADAFERWSAETDVTADEWQIVLELDLLARFDFFWDDFADRVGYHAPGIPEDWKERELHPDVDSWKTVSSINAGLTEFGQTVCEVLKDEYITWESEYEAPEDLPDF
ncbi:hypothetical protein [Halobellus limi]|jgi:hypothetical protein|uniref:DUF7992 domain-containing protein n=1 Tax=Halobellus limi TaxID=699433 RepID=A0A1H5T6V5_9EURY|nr:hypothetical protein [Halobellus limi]QCC47388.1 hypothetical protein DV707_06775 [Halobellus limi]SEF58526.1 hypothetical protein SAMN04488133_0193 [Halobellus limi]